ncbi:U32 family peptidase [bacterium]|nr:U32 family peptidase [bacterium]
MIYSAYISSMDVAKLAYKYGINEFFIDNIIESPFDAKWWYVYEKMVFNSDLNSIINLFKELELKGYYGIRCSDYSLIQIAKDLKTSLKIVWDPKTGGNNSLYYQFFSDIPEIERVSISKELSLLEIDELISLYKNRLELLAYGRFRIFHSKRRLLFPFIENNSSLNILNKKYYLEEEKRENQFFPIEQDQNGTYIYYSKNYFIDPKKLANKNIDFSALLDLKNITDLKKIEMILNYYLKNSDDFLDETTFSPQYEISDEKIYNYQQNSPCFGVVLESVRNGYIYIESSIELKKGDILKFSKLDYIVNDFKYLQNGIYRFFWHKGITSGVTFEIYSHNPT